MSGPPVALLLGPSGAGKTTLARRLAAELALTHLSSGDLLRSLKRQPTALGAELRRCYAAEIPPDAIAERVVLDALAGAAPRRGVLLDGFPRTVTQAAALDAHLAARGREVSVLLHVEVAEATTLARLCRRWVCARCGAIYGADGDPPRRCAPCGLALERRGGDGKPEVLRRRRAVYARDTAPVVERYADRGRLVALDGERAEAEVFRDACAALAAPAATGGRA